MSAGPHDLTGAYAVQALSDTERVGFERHLDTCQACAGEARELAETTARLGAAVATAPPPGLWGRVRDEALGGRAVAGPRLRPLLVAAAVLLVRSSR